MRAKIEFECGLTVCASGPGEFCRFVRLVSGSFGRRQVCNLYEKPLKEDKPGGWLLRLPQCLEENPAAQGWFCPQCKAPAGDHGLGICKDGQLGPCDGLMCVCTSEDDLVTHGETPENPCLMARCLHCEWEGELPVKTG